MNNVTRINNALDGLEESLGVLLEALKEKDSVSLTSNDVFKSIVYDIQELNKYDNKSLGASFAYYRFALSHLNKTFNNKEYIDKEEIDSVAKCLNDIKKLRMKVNVNVPFYRFFDDLRGIVRNLHGINMHNEFIHSFVSSDILKTYEIILNKYHNIITNINEIRPYVNNYIFKSLKIDLDINYSQFRVNLHQIYIQILNSNSDIAQPLMNKLMYYVNKENYEEILKTNMVNKEINNYQKRKDLLNELDICINSLNEIINRYQNSLLDKRNSIDIELVDSNHNEDYGIDIPHFIEDNYEEYRNKKNLNKNNASYSGKIASYIYKFEILKRKLERKKSLTKEEVKLYNKLESELESLKKGRSNNFIRGIKFNYYQKKLNRKTRLSRKNNYKKVIDSNKKRK